MHLLLSFVLLTGGSIRAEDPWIGVWLPVWASASYDRPSRVTIQEHSDGLRLAPAEGKTQTLRRVNRSTAEYTGEYKGQTFLMRYNTSEDGRELLEHSIHGSHDHVFVYDRLDGGQDSANPLAGSWIGNTAKTHVRRQEPRTYEAAEGGALSFRAVGTSYTAAFDGKDHPFSGAPDARKVALRRIDGRSFEETFKDAKGKALNVRKVSVSAEGSEMIFTHSGAFPQGGQGHRVLILRRKK